MRNAVLSMGALVCLLFAVPALALAATPLTVTHASDASSNWAGYVAAGTGITAVSGSWIVPSVTTSAQTAADATWVGIGGVSSPDLIQAGTQALVQNGKVSYEAWYELLPSASIATTILVNAGDSLSASLIETAPQTWQISIQDHTNGQSFVTTASYASSLSSAEWIEEMPSDQNGFIPLDQFGSVSFTNAALVENGTSMTPEVAGAAPLTMSTGMDTALASPSALGDDGASFTVTRSSAAAGVMPRQVSPDGRGGFRRGGSGIGGYAPQSHARTVRVPATTQNAIRSRFSRLFQSARFETRMQF